MFSSVIEAARNSPFKTPVSRAHCESSEENQLVSTRNIQAADALPGDACEFGSLQYFALCGVGGILSCGSTHTFVVPLDLVKCRLQVDQAKYKNLFHGFKITVAEEGARGLAKGWAPTLFGYSAQVYIIHVICSREILIMSWFFTGSLQVRSLWSFQGQVLRIDRRGKLLPVPYWSLLSCISFRWILRRYRWVLKIKALKDFVDGICFQHSHHSRPPRLRSRQLQALLTLWEKHGLRWPRTKVSTLSTRVWFHCGCVKSLTPWWSSHVSKKPLSCFTSKL